MEVLEIVNQIKSKRSFLCVGLDVDLDNKKFYLNQVTNHHQVVK